MNRYAERLAELAKKYRVFCFYSFGSRGREVFELVTGSRALPEKSASDIDIGVHYEKGHRPELDEIISLENELEDLFGTHVDLVDVQKARTFLALDIIKGELLYCNNPDAQAEYELYVLRRAGDQAPIELERRYLILHKGYR